VSNFIPALRRVGVQIGVQALACIWEGKATLKREHRFGSKGVQPLGWHFHLTLKREHPTGESF
jgi:hypothetical protein